MTLTEEILELVNELNQRIRDLEAWQVQAIEQFPDLAIDPIVLKAREISAAQYRAHGDKHMALEIMQGREDDALFMLIAIAALES